MKMLNYLAALFSLIMMPLLAVPAKAQEAARPAATESVSTGEGTAEVEMADSLRRDGKIYIVVIVLLTVLAGVLFYLIRLDQKVSRLEKQMKA
jgi:uncharacterized membrane protein